MSGKKYCIVAALLVCVCQVLACDNRKTPAVSSGAAEADLVKSNVEVSPVSPPAVSTDKPAAAEPQTPTPDPAEKEVAAASAPAPTPPEEPPAEPAVALEGMHVGYPAWDSTPYGYFLYFVPSQEPPKGIIVAVHGGIPKGGDGLAWAKGCIDGFAETAQRQNFVLVAPAFNDPDYGGYGGPFGGYRGLLGRVVSADTFLNSCVDRILATFPELDGKFYLYGDGCGGAFVSRYIVKHPDRVRGAVVCRSDTYAFPFPDVPWTNGMGRLQHMIRWSDDAPYTMMDYTPNPQGWLKASQLPIAVVVGALDTKPIKTIEGEPGLNRVERARNYVREMNDYAQKQGVQGKVRLVEVKGVGFSYLDLLPASILALFKQDSP
ncbi:MAG: hypothetical protein RBU21_10415 [FCB group bacterium]|jgi:pimeloyl-ACP methyl ester carboxylesterase|nr:hypothetical protein [FCB group bacterium]